MTNTLDCQTRPRGLWQRQIEFRTPLSFEECRQRLTMRDEPAEYDFVNLPRTTGIVEPNGFSMSERVRHLGGMRLLGRFEPLRDGSVVWIRDATPRTSYVLHGLMGILYLIFAVFNWLALESHIIWIAGVQALAAIFMAAALYSMVRRRQDELDSVFHYMVTLLDGESTQFRFRFTRTQGDAT